jgi:hypothetical protein
MIRIYLYFTFFEVIKKPTKDGHHHIQMRLVFKHFTASVGDLMVAK